MKIVALLALLLALGPAAGSSTRIGSAASAIAAVAAEPPVGPSAASAGWQWPLRGPGDRPPTILRGFHPPPERWLAGHRGVDLAGAEGDPVYAAGPGVVSYAGPLFGQGVVVITHGSVRTSYEPVVPGVHVGDDVARGSPIGRLAAGHCPDRACLHWGLLTGHRHAVRYYDPLVLLGLSHLRLEPLGSPRTEPRDPVKTRPGAGPGAAPDRVRSEAVRSG